MVHRFWGQTDPPSGLFGTEYLRNEPPRSTQGLFLAKPQSWGAAPRFAVFPAKFTPGCAGPPSTPPAPETCKAP